MNSVLLILIGILVMLAAGAEDYESLKGSLTKTASGYQDVQFSRYFIGLIVVSIPLYLMVESGSRWTNKYILLIALSVMIFHREGIGKFADMVNRQTGKSTYTTPAPVPGGSGEKPPIYSD